MTAPVPAWSGRPPILLISHDGRRTGAPALLLALAEALRRMDRFDLRILTRSGGPLVDGFGRIAPVCVGTDIFPLEHERHVTLPALIAEGFAGLRRGGLAVCNTVVVPEYNEAFRHFGVDVLTLVHELPEFFSTDTMDLIVRSSRYVAVYSDWNRARFAGGYQIPAKKLVIAPPIVTPLAGAVTTADERRAARRAIGVPEDALLVLCVATLYPIKGYDLLLQIVARCARDLPPDLRRRLRVCWVGDTGAGHRLYFDHDVKALGLTDIVSLAGEQADPWPWYQAADVYACSSRWESMGLSVVEAMSAGLPVVGFADVGAIAQFAAEGAGAVVHGLDIDCFAGHLVALLQDPALRVRWGETGHRRVRRMFGSGEIPVALKEIFAAVAARAPTGVSGS